MSSEISPSYQTFWVDQFPKLDLLKQSVDNLDQPVPTIKSRFNWFDRTGKLNDIQMVKLIGHIDQFIENYHSAPNDYANLNTNKFIGVLYQLKDANDSTKERVDGIIKVFAKITNQSPVAPIRSNSSSTELMENPALSLNSRSDRSSGSSQPHSPKSEHESRELERAAAHVQEEISRSADLKIIEGLEIENIQLEKEIANLKTDILTQFWSADLGAVADSATFSTILKEKWAREAKEQTGKDPNAGSLSNLPEVVRNLLQECYDLSFKEMNQTKAIQTKDKAMTNVENPIVEHPAESVKSLKISNALKLIERFKLEAKLLLLKTISRYGGKFSKENLNLLELKYKMLIISAHIIENNIYILQFKEEKTDQLPKEILEEISRLKEELADLYIEPIPAVEADLKSLIKDYQKDIAGLIERALKIPSPLLF